MNFSTPFAPRLTLATAALAIAGVLAAAALGGCANYAGIKSDKQMAGSEQFDSRQSLQAEGGAWPGHDWAAQFGDPQLQQLIDEALADSPSIAEAQARIAKAAAYIETAGASGMPKVTGQYTLNRELYSANGLYPPPFGGNWFTESNALVSASYELDLWGKNREMLRGAISQGKQAEAEAQQAKLSLATSVAQSYNQLARLYALRDVASREITSRSDVGRIAADRVNAGLDTDVEQRTAEGNVATSQTSLSQLDGQIVVTRYQLGALLGKGPDRGLQIAKPTLGAGNPVSLPDNVPADLVARRPDLVAARWRVEATLHDIKVAKTEFYPDLNLAAAFGFDSFGFGRFLSASSRQIQFGPAVHLPIFDAGTLRAQLKGKYADFDSAVANYNKTMIDSLNDVATQIASIRSVDKQMQDAQRAYQATDRAYALAVIRYKAGLSPQLQVLSADMNLLAQEQTVVNLQMSRRDLQVGLVKALGGGFEAGAAGLAMPGEATTGSATTSSTAAPAAAATAPGGQAAHLNRAPATLIGATGIGTAAPGPAARTRE
jgi:NodT family efflux transporter outer membrane factor (OMF) lipoprotein